MTSHITEETFLEFNRVEQFRKIILEDIRIAAAGSLTDEIIEDMMIEVIRNQMRSLVHIYIAGLFRSEILQDDSTIVSLELEYPSTVWNHFKQSFNERFGTHLTVKTTTISKKEKVTFKRNAVYPQLPSLRKEYGSSKAVIRESIIKTEE